MSKVTDFKMAGSIIRKICNKHNTTFVDVTISFDEEIIRLSIHGTLHLLSYTDTSINDARKMTIRQEQLIRELI